MLLIKISLHFSSAMCAMELVTLRVSVAAKVASLVETVLRGNNSRRNNCRFFYKYKYFSNQVKFKKHILIAAFVDGIDQNSIDCLCLVIVFFLACQ
jgi:hypothetical protein